MKMDINVQNYANYGESVYKFIFVFKKTKLPN